MSGLCQICGSPLAGDVALCPKCADLLGWVRSYFAHVPGLETHIKPHTTFKDLGADSLDWMNWLVEAEEKLGIVIPDRDAEKLNTVGQFLSYLRAKGASWARDDYIRLKRNGGCFRNYAWEKIKLDRMQSPPSPGASDEI